MIQTTHDTPFKYQFPTEFDLEDLMSDEEETRTQEELDDEFEQRLENDPEFAEQIDLALEKALLEVKSGVRLLTMDEVFENVRRRING